MKTTQKLQTDLIHLLFFLTDEFEQYKKESIKWDVEDFITRARDIGYKIGKPNAKLALYDMIENHDCNIGITWNTLDYYINEYGYKLKN